MDKMKEDLENALAGISILRDALEGTGMMTLLQFPDGTVLARCGKDDRGWSALSSPVRSGSELLDWLGEICHAVKEAEAIHADSPPVNQEAAYRVLCEALVKTAQPRPPKNNISMATLFTRLAEKMESGGTMGGGGELPVKVDNGLPAQGELDEFPIPEITDSDV